VRHGPGCRCVCICVRMRVCVRWCMVARDWLCIAIAVQPALHDLVTLMRLFEAALPAQLITALRRCISVMRGPTHGAHLARLLEAAGLGVHNWNSAAGLHLADTPVTCERQDYDDCENAQLLRINASAKASSLAERAEKTGAVKKEPGTELSTGPDGGWTKEQLRSQPHAARADAHARYRGRLMGMMGNMASVLQLLYIPRWAS
jgi:hypothetical protein